MPHYIRLKTNFTQFFKVMFIRTTPIETCSKSTLTIVEEDGSQKHVSRAVGD